MRLVPQALPAVLVATVLVAFGHRGDAVEHRPEAGSTLTRTWTQEMTWTLEDLEMALDGSPLEQELPEAGGTNETEIEVTDEILAADRTRVGKLRRTIGGYGAKSSFTVDLGSGERNEYGVESVSDLVDLTVVHAWDAEGEEYDVEFDEESAGDSSLLEGLEMDMSALAFLPAGEVDVDDEWEIEPALLGRLLAPGGDLHSRPDSWVGGGLFTVPTATIVASALTTLPESAAGTIEGDVTARYAGTDEDDDGAFAVIEIDVEVTIETDKTERFQAYCAQVIGDEGSDELVLEDEIDLVGKGRLLWDVEAGRFHSLSFDGEVALVANLAWTESILADAEPMVFEATYEISGTTSIAATCEAE